MQLATQSCMTSQNTFISMGVVLINFAGHAWVEFRTIFHPKIENIVRSVIRWCHQ
ncbi:unnamed protein product [Staurois parvus]|uniref:Uncharacterized protein n=1 Tax=Staurois parvus TaxID=386267 RepID=A0ABN9GTT2_9NEOB|nr:unnamed protein product [Staurois parvus]